MSAAFSFTKLIVRDLEKLAGFYSEVYGLHAVKRVRERIGDEAIDEVMLSPDPAAAFGPLILLRFAGRERPAHGEVLLGFVSDDLPALLDRVRAAGGGIHADIRHVPELGLRVAFATDPEGHLAELVQMLT
jgi:predicted enzyme related to lactoylglutathione lyase